MEHYPVCLQAIKTLQGFSREAFAKLENIPKADKMIENGR